MLEVDEDSRLGAEVLLNGKRYGAPEVPSEDAIADFYETAVESLAALGIPRYEISNFARPGFESRHNLKYWRREPYLGFGADAHSFDGATRSRRMSETARASTSSVIIASPVPASQFRARRIRAKNGSSWACGLREGIGRAAGLVAV